MSRSSRPATSSFPTRILFEGLHLKEILSSVSARCPQKSSPSYTSGRRYSCLRFRRDQAGFQVRILEKSFCALSPAHFFDSGTFSSFPASFWFFKSLIVSVYSSVPPNVSIALLRSVHFLFPCRALSVQRLPLKQQGVLDVLYLEFSCASPWCFTCPACSSSRSATVFCVPPSSLYRDMTLFLPGIHPLHFDVGAFKLPTAVARLPFYAVSIDFFGDLRSAFFVYGVVGPLPIHGPFPSTMIRNFVSPFRPFYDFF